MKTAFETFVVAEWFVKKVEICRGAVAVSMELQKLDINQCPDKYYVPNAFKDTHKCDKKSSYVSRSF